MSEPPVEREEVERTEVEEQEGELLSDREAMSIIRDPYQTPGIVPPGVGPAAPLE